MIIVKLMGGLGNQLFQYAVGRRISFLHNVKLKFDISSLKYVAVNETFRDYALEHFNIKAEIASEREVRRFKILGVKNFKKNNLNFISNHFFKKYIKEENFYFNPLILSIKNNLYLDGYWQSEKYFEDISAVIRKEITPNKDFFNIRGDILDKIEKSESAAVHFRRGDYVSDSLTNKFHGTCSLLYYEKGMKYIADKIGRDIHFFIFSDDISWVKKHLKYNCRKTYVEGYNLRDYEEMILMSKCKHNIIANSSFSWWAAWLNENEYKIVVAPSRWFAADGFDTPERIPISWHQIETTLVVDNN